MNKKSVRHEIIFVFILNLKQYIFKYWLLAGDGGSTVVKVLCYKSEGRWFDPSWRKWILH